ncbi:golgi uridine diphosphate-N- acetylglucosamine transporter [Purpureocillium takamizusanense]|uniref:Golgi uridine diphosphate-N- acetylglucosamine transporter n=1 Tax=Purpureocillium takamizusanense TaxID=2060973 RepID=A0A9Q8V7Y2_9HYPO|nr:golgi uridine diphosphate-N- acetylglucosamine transporter [Purpureocillium takamizusanense]UNI15289.1 golgi uridine diphosphate-N- acetylglucosamine transporter [Purpureocillium takamizusanense]
MGVRPSSNGRVAGPVLEQTDGHARRASFARRLAQEAGPSVASAAVMLALIFGGCCSNVYALEAIINFERSSGTLLTFVQFAFVALTGYVGQFDKTRPPFFIAPAKVPLRRWLVNIVLFFSINVLNNHAFSYDISVPVHIILRSGGSITTMIAGYLYGKRYSRTQALAVVFLSFGVVLAAWSDAKEKSTGTRDEPSSRRPPFNQGLLILFVAQLLSAVMGLYTEATYQRYGPQWRENLFYSHILSLPLFLPFAPSMARTLGRMATSRPLPIPLPLVGEVPSQLLYLATNVLTQYACIRGVNLLAAASSALTVTIVLNIRKLVSLLLSIWLFGNSLAQGTLLGAVVVFGSGALYTMGSRPRKPTAANEAGNGDALKTKKEI